MRQTPSTIAAALLPLVTATQQRLAAEGTVAHSAHTVIVTAVPVVVGT